MNVALLPLFLTVLAFHPSDSSFTDSRDQQTYQAIKIGGLWWMQENLRYHTPSSRSVELTEAGIFACGEFYSLDDALTICPGGWRLPTEKEVRKLLKMDRRSGGVIDQLQISLCGRIDNGIHRKQGVQNTFWIDAEVQDGHILHWHTFAEEQELHSHNVVEAERQFPVRCVCEGASE